MSAAQLDLRFVAPAREDHRIEDLCAFLAGKGWMTARQIADRLGWDDRLVRSLASASDEIISFPGSPGYKLLGECTREEYDRFRNASRSQARQMISRVVRCDRRFFARQPAEL